MAEAGTRANSGKSHDLPSLRRALIPPAPQGGSEVSAGAVQDGVRGGCQGPRLGRGSRQDGQASRGRWLPSGNEQRLPRHASKHRRHLHSSCSGRSRRGAWTSGWFGATPRGECGRVAAPRDIVRLVATDIEGTYVVTRGFRAPFHRGGMLHGLFGRALRKVACAELSADSSLQLDGDVRPVGRGLARAAQSASGGGGMCASACAHPGACDWSRLFDPAPVVPPPHRILSGIREPPSPVLLLSPPAGSQPLAAGDRWSVRLRLFGENGIDAVRVERALEGVADLPIGTDEGRVTLEAMKRFVPRVLALGGESTDSVGCDNTATAETAERTRTGRVTVSFETPARLKRDGRLAAPVDIGFATLFDHVWRRLTTMSALYGQYGPEDDATFRRLREAAGGVRTVERQLRVVRWDHLSTEAGLLKPLRGLLGHLVFEGEQLGAFAPVLKAGELVHVGGNPGLGLGRIRVVSAALPAPRQRR